MFRNPMQAILQFAENRGKDAEILTNRLNNVFEPVANMLTPASAPRDDLPFSMGAPAIAPPPADVPAAAGLAATNPALIRSESGGNWSAQNNAVGSGGNIGHFGRGQFGVARLNDAKRAGVIPADMTPQQFMANPAAQVATEQWHENDIMSFAAQNGITDRIGDTINGVPITREGIVNVAHLGGNAGARRFFETNGQYNPADANGTRLSDYLAMGADGGVDQTYRNIGNALNVSISTSGSLEPSDRRNVESMLGAILNEVYDPESAIADEKRNKVADVLAGLGVGFGQMSRGDRVDLSEVRNAAERRRNQNIQLRMERAKRSAGASYAMELGDEGLARAIAGGAADVSTLLTKRQQDMVERRANESVLRESQQAGMLANVMQEAGGFSESQMEAIRVGANPSAVFSIAEQKRAAEQAAAAQERAESQITFIQEMQQRILQPQQDNLAALPAVDPITERALFLAELDGYQKIYEGGSLNDYMSEARQQAAEMRQQGAVGSDRDTAAELQIQRLLELPEVADRATAIRIRDGVLTLDNDGVLRNTATGEPVNPPTAGLSVPRDTFEVGPPRDETGTSLFDRVGQATGLLSAGAGLLESTVGQVTGGPLFPERSETIQELNTLRGVLVDAFRNSGRLLSQELQLLLEEVAPGSSVWQSPGQLRAKVGSIDRELRQRLAEERARADDPGVPTSERTASANLARDIDRVLTRLHQPAASAAPARAQDAEVPSIPPEIQRSPVFEQLRRSAEQSGVTPEEVWQFLPDSAKQRFLEGAQ